MLVSEKHGVNPSVSNCWLCGKDKGLVLFGKLKGDVEAPREGVFDREPCDECKEWQKKGVILISVKIGDDASDNPYRTGGWCVVKDDAIRCMLEGKLAEHILEMRYAFVPDDVWTQMGLDQK